MNICISDPAVFDKTVIHGVSDTCATCVDDTLYAGDESYTAVTRIIEEKFQRKVRV